MDPITFLLGCAIVGAVAKALKPTGKKLKLERRVRTANAELKKKGVGRLAVRDAVLADSEKCMKRHAQRAARGFDLRKLEDVEDLAHDMRAQVTIGAHVEKTLRKHKATCPCCRRVITSPDQIR